MSKSLVIFLHGVGSSGADLAALGEMWRDAMPDTVFAAPDAPFAFDMGGAGRQWFSVRDVTEENRPARLVAAREAFDELVGGIVKREGFCDKMHRIAFAGFSQGSIMALDALASGRWPIAAVVAFSGRLATPEPLTPCRAVKAMLIHGSADPVMPVSLSLDAEKRLAAEGIAVETEILPGLGHTISAKGAALAQDYLSRLFG